MIIITLPAYYTSSVKGCTQAKLIIILNTKSGLRKTLKLRTEQNKRLRWRPGQCIGGKQRRFVRIRRVPGVPSRAGGPA